MKLQTCLLTTIGHSLEVTYVHTKLRSLGNIGNK